MQIHSFTRFLAAPFMIAMVYVFYKSAIDYDFRDEYSWYVFPLLVICVVLYMFSPQIDFWLHKKYPIKLDQPIINWLEQKFPFYQTLSEEDKLTFQNRLSLFLEDKDFSLMKVEKMDMPDDMSFIIAAHAVWLTFGRPDFLFSKFDRIIAYMHPFPTPFYKHLHTVESEIQDGVVLFSFEYVLRGIIDQSYYNIGIHGFAEAFVESNPALTWPTFIDGDKAMLEEISGLPNQRICDTIGFDKTDSLIVAIHHYCRYAGQFKELLPKEFDALESIFQLSKTNNIGRTQVENP